MDRNELKATWDEAWSSGLWAAAWSKSVEGLTPAQAAWRPAPERHSAWQIAEHIAFWREVAVARTAGGAGPSDQEVAQRNFPQPASPTAAAWNAAVERLRKSQELVAAAIGDPARSVDQLKYLVPHDSYHFGQINYVRALQGVPVAE
jgi:hypothetical protein